MDINSLLSPQDSPPRENAPSVPTASPPKARSTRPVITPNASIRASPLSKVQNSTNAGVQYQAQNVMPSPSHGNFSQQQRTSVSAAMSSPDRRLPQRQASTPGMDTLADLASMQQHQQTSRAGAHSIRGNEVHEAQAPAAVVRPSLQAIARSHSGSKSSLDITMTDAPAQTPPPRNFSAPSLSAADLEIVSQLMAYLGENSNAYESHVQLIKVLYRGFLAHIDPSSTGIAENYPDTYELLGDLLQAMEAMSSRFALGEDLWTARLQVEQAKARSLEDCIRIVELFEKAVGEEVGSARIWSAYGEWMLSLYAASTPMDQGIVQLSIPLSSSIKLSDEEKAIAGEVFGKTAMLDIWKRGAAETKYRLDKGHLVWNKYTELLLADLGAANLEAIAQMKVHFIERLETPHATWEISFQKFSTFISTYEDSRYEETMVAVNQNSIRAKAQWSDREIFETKLQRAAEAEDRDTEWTLLTEYLEWELLADRKQRKKPIFELCNALYQRAVLRFPADVSLWQDYVTFLGDGSIEHRPTLSLLPVLGRACDHCPWSGTLWSQYITAAELEDLPFADIGQIKHKATSTGLLDVSGMEEVIKIHTAWCGFLRRQAFRHDAAEEEHDVAEVGIRSAIEDTENLGKEKQGKNWKGDPQYRLDRIYIKFLVQSRNYTGARDTWQSLVRLHGHSYEFWLRYYAWEMYIWSMLLNAEDAAMPQQTPTLATEVLRKAVQRSDLDWPEKIVETYLTHCEDHGSIEDLQTAMVQCQKTSKAVLKRRNKEVLEQAELQKYQAEQWAAAAEDASGGKRKRDENDNGEEAASSKRTRPEKEQHENTQDHSLQADSALKRDRENATVVVKNLPANVTKGKLRDFFSDCGTINSIDLSQQEDGVTTNARIEFGSKEDVLAAQTRNGKSFEGNTIEIGEGSATTLWVTNFPTTADETYIGELFSTFGEIVDVRFPSLKYNTHRRFCYVQFSNSNSANAATELDGKTMEQGLKLEAKISDPSQKKQRQGPIYEGRELYIKNVDWSLNEDDLQKGFAEHGKIERVRIPRKPNGQSKGFAYVVYSSKEEAEAGLQLDKTKLKTRVIEVSFSEEKQSRHLAATVAKRVSASPLPEGEAAKSPDAGGVAPQPRALRTIHLLNIPDTVNHARLEALVETYGSVKQIRLQPDHQGATVEFTDAAVAGKAALGLEGKEITPGRKISVGTEKEMLAMQAEHRSDKLETGGKKAAKAKQAQPLQPTGPIKRPAQQTGRRGGLGVRRGNLAGGGGHSTAATNGDGNHNGESESSGHKSNADFKAMFAK